MEYYKLLGLEKEPFSTSPNPDFFYLSHTHETAITQLLIELRLKRGLSVIFGDVGTGKTTLSRQLIRSLRARRDFDFCCLFDPSYRTEEEFLEALLRNFCIEPRSFWDSFFPKKKASPLYYRELLHDFLYRKHVVENKTVVLIIDEAQKLSEGALEMIRVLLNYETNETKLIQVVLLGQLELYSRIHQRPNFMDRIGYKYTLNPLALHECQALIHYRLSQAGYRSREPLFDAEAIKLIHKASQGYPRKLIGLCHRALISLIKQEKMVVTGDLVYELIQNDFHSLTRLLKNVSGAR